MSHLHRGRFLRLNRAKGAAKDAVREYVPAALPATPHRGIGAPAPARAAAKVKASNGAGFRAKSARSRAR